MQSPQTNGDIPHGRTSATLEVCLFLSLCLSLSLSLCLSLSLSLTLSLTLPLPLPLPLCLWSCLKCLIAPLQANHDVTQHILGYPFVNDSVQTIRKHEYGQLTISLGESTYQRLGAPIVSMLAWPYQYVSPYVQRADSIGDRTLSKLDERFPAIRKPTGELYADAKGLVMQTHVADVYGQEYKKNGSNGLPSMARSAVSTVLIVSSETLGWLLGFLAQKKRHGEDALDRTVDRAREAAKEKREKAHDSIDGAWD